MTINPDDQLMAKRSMGLRERSLDIQSEIIEYPPTSPPRFPIRK